MIKNGKIFRKEWRGVTGDCYAIEVEILRCYYTCTTCHTRYNFRNKKQAKKHFKYESGYGVSACRQMVCNRCLQRGRGRNYILQRRENL